MKKILLLMLAFAACFAGAKADELTVADGTDTSTELPIKGLYCDNVGITGQMLYPKADLADMEGGTISQVKFYPNGAISANLAGCVLQLSLLEVESDEFTYESYKWQLFIGATACGSYTVAGNETELVFDLTDTFEYSGNKNLLVEVKVTTKSGYSTINFYGKNQSSTTGISYYSSSNHSVTFLPKATFEYTSEVPDYAAKVNPETCAFGKVALGETATTNVTIHNKGANAFTPSLSGLAAPFSTTYTAAAIAAGETATVPVTFAPTTVGDYTATLTVDCGQAGTHQVALSGTCKDGIDLDVASGTGENNSLPFCGNYCDTQNTISQMIYPKTDLASMANGTISEIKFYPTAALDAALANCVLQISLKEVADATFSSAAAITGTEVCGTYTIAGGETEVVFELSNPFEYSGDNNLLIETKVITKSGYKDTKFYGVTQSTNTGYCSAYGFGLQKFLPRATFTYTHVSHPYKAEVTPDALDFGKVNPGETSILNVTIENKGTNAFTPSLSGLAAPFSTTYTTAEIASGAVATVPVTFAPTTVDDFSGTLTINCGEAGTFDVALSGKGFETGSEVVVCDGTDASSNVPVYGAYYDTQNCQVQFIYPAEMLADLSGRKITKVTFFPAESVKIYNGALQFSVKETEQSVFEREGYSGKPDNVVADMTVVATITPNANDTELVFEFSEPLLYNGGNLAFETLATTAGQWANTSFYGVNQSSYTAFHYGTSSYNGMDRFLPKAQFESTANTPEPSTVTLAEVLSGAAGEYTIGDDVVVAAVAPQGNMCYVTNGSEWLPVSTTNTYAEGDKLTTLAGTFNGSATAPVFTLTSAETSTADVTATITAFWLGQDHTGEGHDAEWDHMPAAGEVANFYGYFFTENEVPTLRGYTNGTGRGIVLKGDNYGTVTMPSNKLCKVTVAIELVETGSGAPKRIAVTEEDAANLRGQVLAIDAQGPHTAIDSITANDGVARVRYYNVAGVESDKPFDGVNIVVTEYNDGTKTTNKEMR